MSEDYDCSGAEIHIADLEAKLDDARVEIGQAWSAYDSASGLWDSMKASEDRLNESCAAGDPLDIIKARCVAWRESFKAAICAYLEQKDTGIGHD
jgi:hypothetical protein